MEIKRIYTVPLKDAWLKKCRQKRAKRTINFLREWIKKHTKSEKIKISPEVSKEMYAHGFKKPPSKLKVIVEGNEKEILVNVFRRKEEKETRVEEKIEKKEENENENKEG